MSWGSGAATAIGTSRKSRRNPRPLGLVPASGVVQIALPVDAGTALQNISALAVSLEPRGGSPTGLPTGPVLYSGPVERLY